MTRIPLKTDAQVGPPDLVEAIRRRRGGQLVELDRLLLYSPPLAEGWNEYMGRVRSALTVPPLLKELAMCVVAILNGAEYEFFHHAPLYRSAGASQAQADALRDPQAAADDSILFDPAQRATIRLTIEMTCHVAVPDDVFSAARSVMQDDRQLVELIAVIAAYNMVSRLLVALQLTPD